MMPGWDQGQVVQSLPARRDLDVAIGMLMVLRGYDSRSAFDELLNAAKRHQVPVFTMAAALVDLAAQPGRSAQRGRSASVPGGPAHSAAHQQWGPLLELARNWRSQ